MIIGWFSCGVTSAVACHLALLHYTNVEIYYIETGSSHNDNTRFINDCEHWFNKEIHILRNDKYTSVIDVLSKKRYINGPAGAPCTLELKKRVRYALEDKIGSWDGQVFGFEYSKKEIFRANRFKEQYPATKPLFPLIEHQLTKQNCMALLEHANIALPLMYLLGYHNNNCIGCVKGGMAYWNKIRNDFPAVFKQMCQLERNIGATCLKDNNGRLFLDELEPNRGNFNEILTPECSLFCEIEFADIDKYGKSI